jgi:hypothetical protein
MSVDPNNIKIDWSSTGTNSAVNTVTSSATGTTQNPLITSCTEGANPLISHEVFTENGSKQK